MTTDEARWAELGEALNDELRRAEAYAVEELIEQFVTRLEVVVSRLEGRGPIVDAVRALLAKTTFEDWDRASPESLAANRWRVLRTLKNTYAWADSEGGEPDAAWALFEGALAEDLRGIHDWLRAACAECGALANSVAALPLDASSTWPLEFVGLRGELHRGTIGQIAERTGWPLEVPDGPGSTEPCYVMVPDARVLETLPLSVAERAAWADTFHRLGSLLRRPLPH